MIRACVNEAGSVSLARSEYIAVLVHYLQRRRVSDEDEQQERHHTRQRGGRESAS